MSCASRLRVELTGDAHIAPKCDEHKNHHE